MSKGTGTAAMTAALDRMTRRHLIANTSRLGLLTTLGSLWPVPARTAAEARDEPWLDGSLWSDGTGWQP